MSKPDPRFALAATITVLIAAVIGVQSFLSGGAVASVFGKARHIDYVTIDARQYLSGNGLPEDPAKVRAFAAACGVATRSGSVPHLHAAGKFVLRVDPQLGSSYGERYALLIKKCDNATIDFAKAVWLFDDDDDHGLIANVIGVEDSSVLRGSLGTIDWVRPPFVQATVLRKGVSAVDLKIDAGFSPKFDEVQRIEAYARDGTNINKILSKSFSEGADVRGWPVSYPAAGVMRIACSGDAACAAFLRKMRYGELYVLTYRVYGGDAIRLHRVSGAHLALHVVTTAGMAVRVTDGSDTQLDVKVQAPGGKLISATADGVHVRANRGDLTVAGQVWNTGDDPLNVELPSYRIVDIVSLRSFVVAPGYPSVMPRIGDALIGSRNDGKTVSLGRVMTVRGTTIAVGADLPGGFNRIWRVADASAHPATTVDLTVGYARGHVRVSVPNAKIKVKATNLWGSVAAEYVPSLTGEGMPPHHVSIDADLTNSARYSAMPGAIVVQAYKLDNSGYDPAGTIEGPVIRASVIGSGGSAIFLAGTRNGQIDLTTRGCCLRPDTKDFAMNDRAIALVNAAQTRITSTGSAAAMPTAHIGLSGTSSVEISPAHRLRFTVDR